MGAFKEVFGLDAQAKVLARGRTTALAEHNDGYVLPAIVG